MAGGGEKDSELPGVREDIGGSFQLELKLLDSLRGSTSKGMPYVMHLVFLCELFHNKVSLASPGLQPQTFYYFQATTCPEGKLSTLNKSLNCRKKLTFFRNQIKLIGTLYWLGKYFLN